MSKNKLHFTKMHGIGNDFIVIDITEEELPGPIEETVRRICHRRFGIGADQVLLLGYSDKADFRMDIYNSDGGQIEMCGNGIRALAKYIWDREMSYKDVLEIETLAGIIKPARAAEMVRVDMGNPEFDGRRIPVALDGNVTDHPIKALDKEFKITCVSMGNPHAVIYVEDPKGFDVHRYGPVIENDPLFPNRINVEFIKVHDRGNIEMRVWERGAGETLACGTGATAAAVVSMAKGLVDDTVKVHLLGGVLEINWTDGQSAFMTGPAEEVFTGKIKL